MKVLNYAEAGFEAALKQLNRASEPAANVEKSVKRIIAEVRSQGDAGLLRLTRKFGGPRMDGAQLRVSQEEIEIAEQNVPDSARKAISGAHANVLAFAKRGLRKEWSMKNRQGAQVGERFDPYQRVGIYVPGGTAPLVSSAIMTVTLAAAAGVPQIVVMTPPDASGCLNARLLYALQYAGATEIYKAGGAQAIAALAYGTTMVAPVLKIFGPGNAYVVEAKRQVFGRVAVDLLPGPSEIMVIADKTARASWIAADLLAQAEHGRGSSVGLVTDCERLLREVESQLAIQTKLLSRSAHLAEALDEGLFLILVGKIGDAARIANEFAPEHLSIVAKNDEKIARSIFTAGAIFLGPFSPVVGGDFVAGPSHELPTGGAGKSFCGLTVDQFQRRTSVLRFDELSLAKSLPVIQAFSDMEGLDAHGRSASIRVEVPSARGKREPRP